MRFSITVNICFITLLLVFMLFVTACSAGSDVYLENVSIGNVMVEGKPVTGLPTQTVNIVIKAGAEKILISQSNGKTIIKLQPSGAVITSSNEGISFTGVKPDQVEIKWNTDNLTR
jgi:ABC-type enterochelin transport system substrate-binding protein